MRWLFSKYRPSSWVLFVRISQVIQICVSTHIPPPWRLHISCLKSMNLLVWSVATGSHGISTPAPLDSTNTTWNPTVRFSILWNQLRNQWPRLHVGSNGCSCAVRPQAPESKRFDEPSIYIYMGVSVHGGTPKSIYRWVFPYKPSSFWGTPHDYGNPHIDRTVPYTSCTGASWPSLIAKFSAGRVAAKAPQHFSYPMVCSDRTCRGKTIWKERGVPKFYAITLFPRMLNRTNQKRGLLMFIVEYVCIYIYIIIFIYIYICSYMFIFWGHCEGCETIYIFFVMIYNNHKNSNNNDNVNKNHNLYYILVFNII